MKAVLFRTLILTHRYIGIGIGWLMLMWGLSGLVMLYVEYPQLRDRERQAVLGALDTQNCCTVPEALFDPEAKIAAVAVEMLVDEPVLWVEPELGAAALVNLRSGVAIDRITEAMALQSASRHRMDTAPTPVMLGLIERDQWTVYPRYGSHLPLYHIALNDAAGTQVYVSSVTGQVVQQTRRTQRFWNWLGTVPHWLYFTAIRQNAALWNNLVIYSSLLGCFLTLFGLYLGVLQLRRRSDNLLVSPYRGWMYWHHVPGLVFGVLVLTWVFSGLMSMQPWGFLESDSFSEDVDKVRGKLPSWRSVHASLQTLGDASLPADTVRLSSSLLHGEMFYLATDRSSYRTRMNEGWQVRPVFAAEIQQAGQALGASRIETLHAEDEFYYAVGKDEAPLPTVRVTLPDDTRYYLDATTGGVLMKIDDAARWYRWLHLGLHRMDFTPWLRARPLWDVWMWLLLGGVVTICTTGFWLGIRRLRGR